MKNVILLIMDGLGDRPNEIFDNKTALQYSYKPNMDFLAEHGVTGLMSPVSYGIRSGSDTSHLSILGYRPEDYYTGRGPFEAMGLGIDLKPGDIAFRANYASVVNDMVVDRRAGRIRDTNDLSKKLETEINGIKIIMKSGVEHRAALVLRGDNLSDKVSDTDPHGVNSKPLNTSPLDDNAKFTASIINKFLERSRKILNEHKINKDLISNGKLPANEILLRGAGKVPELPDFNIKYNLRAACISGTPLIRGIAKLAGFDIIDVDGMNGRIDTNYKNIINSAMESLNKYNFILINIKGADIGGHDKKPEIKKYAIEETDRALKPFKDVLNNTLIVITGDHSTPCSYGDHSGDPVPILFSTDGIINDDVKKFDELSVSHGYYKIKSNDIMPLILSYSDRSEKYGA